MKDIIETDECYEFRALLTDEESAEYRRIRLMLNRDGRLEYPWGEKVEGEVNTFRDPHTQGRQCQILLCIR